MHHPRTTEHPQVSIVVPVLNESRNVAPFVERCLPAIETTGESYELLFVDDGSTDDTAEMIAKLSAENRRIRIVRLSRNFGHQAALVAGMEQARGDAIITMDGDLQHPPELIGRLVARWRTGGEVVQAIRREPADGSAVMRSASTGFYRLLSILSKVQVTPGAADFRLMSREAADAFLSCGERSRFNRGLVQWIGFRYSEIEYDAEARFSGDSKYTWPAKVRLAADAIFSFSWWPLRLAGLLGVIVSCGAAFYLLFVIWASLFTDRTEKGWSSTIATVLVIGGMQLIVLWIIGEYIGRLYEEAKQRPIYIARHAPTGDVSVSSARVDQDAGDQVAQTDVDEHAEGA